MWGWIKLNIVLFVISNLYIAAAKLQLFFDICKPARVFPKKKRILCPARRDRDKIYTSHAVLS